MTMSAFGVEDTRHRVVEKAAPRKRKRYLTRAEERARGGRIVASTAGGVAGTMLRGPIAGVAGAGLGYGTARLIDQQGSIRGSYRPR